MHSKNFVLQVNLHSLLVSASRFFKVFSFSFRLPLLLFTFILCRDQTHLDQTLSNKMKTSLRYALLACLAAVSAAPLLERDSIGKNPCYLILFLLLIGTRCLLSSTRPIAALRSVLSISLLLWERTRLDWNHFMFWRRRYLSTYSECSNFHSRRFRRVSIHRLVCLIHY